ncbi:MAG: ABC transporter substrate-binding protein, partial [Ilumatobacteraceae bacterium]
SPALSDYPDNALYFRNAPPDGLQGAVVANQIVEDGNASVYIMNLDDAYGNGIAAVVKDVLEAAGVTVLGVKAYDPAAASYDAEVAEIVSADPDAVVLVSFDEGSRILRQRARRELRRRQLNLTTFRRDERPPGDRGPFSLCEIRWVRAQ